jgi:hypothetical protein
VNGLEEFEIQIVLEILAGSAPLFGSASSASKATKATKDIAEDVSKLAEYVLGRVEAVKTSRSAESGMAKLVVSLFLFWS